MQRLSLRSPRRLLAALSLLFGGLLGSTPARPEASLLVYDFQLGMTPAAAVPHLRSLGFDGVVTSVRRQPDIQKLSDYVTAAAGRFEVMAYVHFDFADAANARVWEDALPILGALDAPLWVILENAPDQAALDDQLLRMAQAALAEGVRAVVYPHWDTSLESAAEAAAAIARVGHGNLASSFHTCHEIRAGHQRRLGDEFMRHLAGCELVTLAGSSKNAYAGPPPGPQSWADAIQPLDRGTHDLVPFLQALEASGYDGPVVLHTWGITGDPGHRARSRAWYARQRERLP